MVEREHKKILPQQVAAITKAGELADRIEQAGKNTEAAILFYESVLPEGELLSNAQIVDRVFPQSRDSHFVKQHALQIIVKKEMPDDVRREIAKARQGAFTLRTLNSTDPEILKANRAKGMRNANRRINGKSLSSEDIELMRILAQSPDITTKIIADKINEGREGNQKFKLASIRAALRRNQIRLANRPK